MSKQSEAKKAQGYIAKVVPQTCGNCANYRSVLTEREGRFGGKYIDEKDKTCSIGRFAVKKTGSCRMHTPKLE